jgi:hypothetical protein
VGSLTSHNPIGLHGLLQDSFTFLLFTEEGEWKVSKALREVDRDNIHVPVFTALLPTGVIVA